MKKILLGVFREFFNQLLVVFFYVGLATLIIVGHEGGGRAERVFGIFLILGAFVNNITFNLDVRVFPSNQIWVPQQPGIFV